MSLITLISGEEKTGKTAFALTFPKPLVDLEFDIGGFDRAKSRLKSEELQQITVIQYPSLLQTEFKSKAVIESLMILGEKERWQSVMKDFAAACRSKDVRTIVYDTWFQFYELSRQAYLQTLQEAQLDEHGILKKNEAKFREALQQVEYTQPYAKLRSVMFYAKGCGKNLVLVTYDADEYKRQIDDDGKMRDIKTGKKIPAGWKETEKHVDIAFWTDRTDTSCGARVTLPGTLPPEAVGTEIDNNYEALENLLRFYKCL